MLLRLDHVTHYFGDALVLQDVSAVLQVGERVGLVGVNGAGKSTLLRIAAGLLLPDDGRIERSRGARIGFVAQRLDVQGDQTVFAVAWEAFFELDRLRKAMAEAERQLASPALHEDPRRLEEALARYARLQEAFERGGGFEAEARVRAALFGLGFTAADLDRSAQHLSGGQQARLALARALLEDPDVLLLDEPTNHLDLAATEWLEGFLGEFKGAVLVASHDRAFLDAICGRIWELEGGRLTAYTGNYAAYRRQRAERRARQQALYKAQQEEIAALEAYIRRYQAGNRATQAKSRAKRLARLERVAPVAADPQGPNLRLGSAGRTARIVAELVGGQVGYAGNVVLGGIDLMVSRGDRIGMIGPNGAGKSTLLKSLCGRLPLLGGELSIGAGVRFGYFSQDEAELDPGRSVLETLLEARRMPLGDARGYLARFLFRGEEVNKPLAALSGGERSRLRLACLLVQEANVLCLDEPTNHLDAPAREALEEALAAYPGTLIFISHDRYLLDRIAAKLWVVADGGVEVIDATYSAWRAAARAEAARSSPPPQTARRSRPRRSPSPAAIAPTVAEIEADIAKLEARRAELEQRLADPAQHQADPTGLRRAAASLETVVAELERLYALWEEAAERDLRT